MPVTSGLNRPAPINGRLLLIEDSPVQRRELAAFIESAGYMVGLAENGERGLKQLAESPYDALLCDLHLPGIDGFEVCRRVKADPNLRDVPVILITRWADPLNILRGLEAGAEGFISKGQRRSEIIQRVRRVIARATAPAGDDLESHVLFLNTEFRLTARRDQLLEVLLAGFEDTVYLNEKYESEMRERLQAEATARAEIAKFHALFQSAADGIMLIDGQGEIRLVNPTAQAMFAATADELIGLSIESLIPELRQQPESHANADLIPPASPNRSRHAIEGLARNRQAQTFPVEFSISETPTVGETLLTVFVRDISDRKAADMRLQLLTEELKRSNGELEQFAYAISHDLKEPLRMVHSFTGLLDAELGPLLVERPRRFMSRVVEGAERMRRMIDDLLAYARVGQEDITPDLVDLNEVVTEVQQNLGPAIEQTGATIHRSQLPSVIGIRSLLMRLFQNLLGNALKFHGSREPVVAITCSVVPDGWQFTVTDNGIGIAAAHRERVFQIFQRLHTGEEYEGTGVGLAICRKIVEHHGGRIWIQPSDFGTTISFTLKSSVKTPAETTQAECGLVEASSLSKVSRSISNPEERGQLARQAAASTNPT